MPNSKTQGGATNKNKTIDTPPEKHSQMHFTAILTWSYSKWALARNKPRVQSEHTMPMVLLPLPVSHSYSLGRNHPLRVSEPWTPCPSLVAPPGAVSWPGEAPLSLVLKEATRHSLIHQSTQLQKYSQILIAQALGCIWSAPEHFYYHSSLNFI